MRQHLPPFANGHPDSYAFPVASAVKTLPRSPEPRRRRTLRRRAPTRRQNRRRPPEARRCPRLQRVRGRSPEPRRPHAPPPRADPPAQQAWVARSTTLPAGVTHAVAEGDRAWGWRDRRHRVRPPQGRAKRTTAGDGSPWPPPAVDRGARAGSPAPRAGSASGPAVVCGRAAGELHLGGPASPPPPPPAMRPGRPPRECRNPTAGA